MKSFRSDKRGFTLMEMLIVVAIIAIIVAISIPMLLTKREKVRETTDLANLRAAYAEVMADMMLYDPDPNEKVVDLVQGQDGWLEGTGFEATLHGLGQVSGTPAAFGQCTVKWLRDDQQVMFDFDGTGGGSGGSGGPNIPIDMSTQRKAGMTAANVLTDAIRKAREEGYWIGFVPNEGDVSASNLEGLGGRTLPHSGGDKSLVDYMKENYGYELPADAGEDLKRYTGVWIASDSTVPVYHCSQWKDNAVGWQTTFYKADGTELDTIDDKDYQSMKEWVVNYLYGTDQN